MRHLGGTVWLLVAVGCGGGAAAYPPAWVGTDDARRTGWTADEADVPAPLRETVMDEGTLAYADAQTACFDVTVRSLAAADVALGGASPRCTAGGGPDAVTAAAETSSVEMVSVYDYADNGDLVATVAEQVPAEGYEASSEPPPAGAHRVVERHARLCCAVPAADRLALSVGAVELTWQMR